MKAAVDGWLSGSPALKILAEGDDRQELIQRLAELARNDLPRATRINSVCARLEFVEQLRHAAQLSVSWERVPAAQYQLDRLVAYLSITCIDAARGEKFEHFHQWLARAVETGALPQEWPNAMRDLAAATNEQDAAARYERWTRRISESYYIPNVSSRKAFHRFLWHEAQDWLRLWLADAYFIVKGDVIDGLFTRDWPWLQWDAAKRCVEIANHFYSVRNRYTHAVEYASPMELKSGSISIPVDGVKYVFTMFSRHGDLDQPVETSVGLREGLAESDIVRLLVVCWIRRNWLGIHDSSRVMESYLRRVAFREAAYRFLLELRNNLHLIESWGTAEIRTTGPRLAPAGLVPLSDAAAADYQVRRADVSQVPGFGNLGSYLNNIRIINSLISQHNQRHEGDDSWRKNEAARQLCAQLVKMDEVRWALDSCEMLEQDVFNALDRGFY